MKIKVNGMSNSENIRAVAALGIDMLGFNFIPGSPRFVRMRRSLAGIIPDYCGNEGCRTEKVSRVGVFADDMPQNIIIRVYNYALDYVQLDGDELPVMIDNLLRTLKPDIQPNIKIIKTIRVGCRDDVQKYKTYEGLADLFLFKGKVDSSEGLDLGCKGTDVDFDGADTDSDGMSGGCKGKSNGCSEEFLNPDLLDDYDGSTPFILGGNIGPNDAVKLSNVKHPMFWGVDIDSLFETKAGIKDVELIKTFIAETMNGVRI